jgi:hypothetical protein
MQCTIFKEAAVRQVGPSECVPERNRRADTHRRQVSALLHQGVKRFCVSGYTAKESVISEETDAASDVS